MSRSALTFSPTGFGHYEKIGGKPRAYTFKFNMPVNATGTATYGTSLCAGDPIAYLAGNPNFVGLATVGVANNAHQILGSMVNIEYTDINNRVVLDNKWVANTTVRAGSEILMTVDIDPMVVWEVQCTTAFTGLTFGQGGQGLNANFLPGTPNLNTGTSTAALNTAPGAAGSGNEIWRNYKIIGLSGSTDITSNAWTAPYPWVLVTINDGVLKAGTIGVN